jgi:hypothetical protein
MVAAGHADDASRALRFAECREAMPGAAYLEGADRLEAFSLAPDGAAFHFERKQRGSRQDLGDLARGKRDAIGGGVVIGTLRHA